MEINDYIKARLSTPAISRYGTSLGRNVSKISVSRELSFIKKLFDNLRHQESRFKGIPNPVTEYDKDLLKNRDPKNDYRLSDEDKEILFTALDKHPNPEMKQICLLSYYCGFRRSEIVPLTWEQVHLNDNYIQLYQTKSGRPRKVIITKEAREILENIPKKENQPRLFTYTLFGFSGSFDKFIERIGLKAKGFHFHFFFIKYIPVRHYEVFYSTVLLNLFQDLIIIFISNLSFRGIEEFQKPFEAFFYINWSSD